MLRGIVRTLGGLLSRDNPADEAEEKRIVESLVVRVCWACRGDPKPLLVLSRGRAKPEEPYPKEAHAYLMRCEACELVQLDFRNEAGEGAGHCFDTTDSAKLGLLAQACPKPLSPDCACELHGSLRQLPPVSTGHGRYPDPAIYDLPRLALAADGPPRIVLRDGPVSTSYDEATRKAAGTLVDGVEEGPWTLWHDNGTKKCEGTYSHGLRTGTWTHWLPSGHLHSRETWGEGTRIALEVDPGAAIEGALVVPYCLACFCERIELVVLLERRGIAPELEGHQIAYDHRVILRCPECGAGQLDRRAKDSSDWESVYEQGEVLSIDAEGMSRLAAAMKDCPKPLSEDCRCKVHKSLQALTAAIPHAPEVGFEHVPVITIEPSPKGPRVMPRHGSFATKHSNGNPRAEGSLVAGLLDGRCTRWHRNGQKALQGEMRRGVREGRWIEWDDEGELKFDREWKDGYTV
jgi:hypothetical protein